MQLVTGLSSALIFTVARIAKQPSVAVSRRLASPFSVVRQIIPSPESGSDARAEGEAEIYRRAIELNSWTIRYTAVRSLGNVRILRRSISSRSCSEWSDSE